LKSKVAGVVMDLNRHLCSKLKLFVHHDFTHCRTHLYYPLYNLRAHWHCDDVLQTNTTTMLIFVICNSCHPHAV